MVKSRWEQPKEEDCLTSHWKCNSVTRLHVGHCSNTGVAQFCSNQLCHGLDLLLSI